jgi:hypothetical protein
MALCSVSVKNGAIVAHCILVVSTILTVRPTKFRPGASFLATNSAMKVLPASIIGARILANLEGT